MSASQRNDDATLVAITPSLGAILRHHTFGVLERHHHAFNEVHERSSEELVMMAEIFGDAVAVLDAIGWIPDPAAETVNVSISDAHLTQLREQRADLGMTVLDYLDIRADIDTTAELAEVDEFINRYHRESSDLLSLIRACR
jgi:hypothetical protein